MKTAAISLTLIGLCVFAIPANAHAQVGNSFTADEARQARDRGAVVPLKDIFRDLKKRHGGYQIDANLYNRGNRQVYVIDWMTGKGERIRVEVDAKTGRVIK
ncbi:MAG: PepSY domain-containing protein [Pseudomonadota bacterium]